VGNRLPCVHHQVMKKCELLRSQAERATSLLHQAPRSIKMQISDIEENFFSIGDMIPRQRSTNSRDQLVEWQQIYCVIAGDYLRRPASYAVAVSRWLDRDQETRSDLILNLSDVEFFGFRFTMLKRTFD
jgi:hypothetical protein